MSDDPGTDRRQPFGKPGAATYYGGAPTRVEYVTTSDGVRIAYARRGRGQVVVWMPPIPARHIELEWKQPDDRRWLEWLASRYTLVQYDPRGMGLSDRNVGSFSLEAFERDLDAVVGRVATGAVSLFAKVNSGAMAVAYAAHHPERVSQLMLWCATPRVAEGVGSHLDALIALAERDWDLFVQTAAHLVRGWTNGESANQAAVLLRAALSRETVPALLRDALTIDATEFLGQVQAPTLVLHRRGVTWIPLERAIDLAAGIPGARLVQLEGDSMALWSGDTSDVTHVVADFLGPGGKEETPRLISAVPTNAFRHEGEYWTLAFSGRFCRLRDAKGLHHIAHLLGRPGEHVPALDLLAELDGHIDPEPPGARGGPTVGSVGDAGPMLDARARTSYRRRLDELRSSLAEAERHNDTGLAVAARTEIEFIEDQLAAAIGLWGRDRRAASAAERARLTVTKRIKGVLDRISSRHPTLGEHLTRTLKTGLLCAYVPDRVRPPRWWL
jgi:pimeloyl-ACP methyl ester carboxylesterase